MPSVAVIISCHFALGAIPEPTEPPPPSGRRRGISPTWCRRARSKPGSAPFAQTRQDFDPECAVVSAVRFELVDDARVVGRRSARRGGDGVEDAPGDVVVGRDGAHLEPAAATGAGL
jgi:hypothetical protein